MFPSTMTSPRTPSIDFDPTASKAYALIVSAVFLQIISTVGVVLRFYARGKAGAHLWIDDWLVLAAWVGPKCLPLLIVKLTHFLDPVYGQK